MGVRGENIYPLEQAWASFNSIKSFWVSVIYQLLVSDGSKTQSCTQSSWFRNGERHVNTYIIIHCNSENSRCNGCTEEGVINSIGGNL